MGCQQVRPQDADLLPACGDDALLPETGDVSREIDPVGRKDIRQLLLAQINDWARLCLLSFCPEIEKIAQLYEGAGVLLVRRLIEDAYQSMTVSVRGKLSSIIRRNWDGENSSASTSSRAWVAMDLSILNRLP